MIHVIHKVIPEDTLAHIRSLVADAEFVDGVVTAGYAARLVKNNRQLPGNTEPANEIAKLIFPLLQSHSEFQSAVLPRVMHSMLISRYDTGMAYGQHVDDALMTPQRIRTDVSVTLFLSNPDEYEGGELIIPPGAAVKLPAGSLIAYPSTSIHEVRPILSGRRHVAAFWVECLVRDAAQREILYDLDYVARSLFQNQGKTPEYDRVSKTRANLLRAWVG